jgi:hypothetical protein
VPTRTKTKPITNCLIDVQPKILSKQRTGFEVMLLGKSLKIFSLALDGGQSSTRCPLVAFLDLCVAKLMTKCRMRLISDVSALGIRD